MDINNFLNGMSKDSIRQLSGIVNTPAGQELMKKLKNVDKNQLMRQISSMNEGDLPRKDLLRQLTSDPELVKKLNNFLDRK